MTLLTLQSTRPGEPADPSVDHGIQAIVSGASNAETCNTDLAAGPWDFDARPGYGPGSSMGDVIHNLPAVTDLARAFPDAAIDWVVEEGFQEIPRLHPAIRKVIPIALRRWRKAPLASLASADLHAFASKLRREHYDLVLDSQGLVKSALVARLAHGPVAGYDRSSAREPAASVFYSQRYRVSRDLHAIERNRWLSGLALGYAVQGLIDYGLPAPKAVPLWLVRKLMAPAFANPSPSIF